MSRFAAQRWPGRISRVSWAPSLLFCPKFLAGFFARCILVGFGWSRFVGGLSGDSVESLYPYRLDTAAECAVLLSILCVSSYPYILRSMSRLPT